MSELGIGEIIYSLQKKIQKIQSELDALGEPTKHVPELISSANLLRSNEYLLKSNEKKSELLQAYEQYSKYLESMISDIFEIQHDLKEILKEQSALLASVKESPKKPKSRKKTSKK
jgi:hypothetical protein